MMMSKMMKMMRMMKTTIMKMSLKIMREINKRIYKTKQVNRQK